MRWKDLQQTYKRDEAAYQKALAALDAAKDDSSDDALAHLDEVPPAPPNSEDPNDEEQKQWMYLVRCSRG
jgi:hypothetical protein